MERKLNFSAGPSIMPIEVLEQIQDEILEFQASGLSLIESSHRTSLYDDVHQETLALLEEALGIPEGYHTLLLGGGATLQFGMVPMNLMGELPRAAYINSGAWAAKAISDAMHVGEVKILWDGKDVGYRELPDPGSLPLPGEAAYLHITSNETIGGVQWWEFPASSDVPLVADMSSDILSRPIRVEDFGLIYAGAQKNMGPAGVTVVIIRKNLLALSPSSLPTYLNYRTHASKNSLYNTPPVFSIYVMGLMLKWLKKLGGVAEMEKRNRRKGERLYSTIEKSGGFYKAPVAPEYRSMMNVVFLLPTKELEVEFLELAEQHGMLCLRGHRDVGGCRASIYNAMPEEGVVALVDLMEEFARTHG